MAFAVPVTLLALLTHTQRAWSQQQLVVTLEAVPATIEVSVDQGGEAQVVIRNPTTETLWGVELNWFSNPPGSVVVTPHLSSPTLGLAPNPSPTAGKGSLQRVDVA